jgi:hypothetical protein
MKRIFVISILSIIFAACGENPADNALPVQTKTATDTITNVTNPGVGSAADDTSARPFK